MLGQNTRPGSGKKSAVTQMEVQVLMCSSCPDPLVSSVWRGVRWADPLVIFLSEPEIFAAPFPSLFFLYGIWVHH